MRWLFTSILTASLAFGAAAGGPDTWTDGYVWSNGIRIHYIRSGGAPAKPVMVLAHGSSDDARCWTNLAKEFTDRYDVIAFDARGHGLTDPPKPGDLPDAQVEDLAGLIRGLNLVKPILMGHSMGSASVAWFSAKYPDVPGAVILEDPALIPNQRPTGPRDAEELAKQRATMIARNNQTEAELVATCMKNSPKWGLSECENWAPSKRRHHPDTARAIAAGRPLMKDLFSKITAPTLILKADAQGDVRTQNEQVTKILARGKIVHIDGAGHNVRRENKAQTIEVMNAFLGKL